MYLVHPGYAGDCDFEGVAKEGVIRELDYAVKEEQRAILIYPTNAGVYIDSDKVTDVRGGYEEENWISYDDFQGVSCATFVGGKIRKCLGVFYGNFIDVAERMGIEEISVRLPLESIYTEHEYTAADELLAGISSVGVENSLRALLTPFVQGDVIYCKSQLEYGFINTNPMSATEMDLYLNGEYVESFGGGRKLDVSNMSVSSGFLLDDEIDPNPLEIKLLVECDMDRLPEDENISDYVSYRWGKIKDWFA